MTTAAATNDLQTKDKSSAIIAETVPIGSMWIRTRGKHSGRSVQVESTSLRGVKIALTGKTYQNSHGAQNSEPNTVQVPFDMFANLYKPESPNTLTPPTKADVHIWHMESNIACNCPRDLQALAESKLLVLKSKKLDLAVKSVITPHKSKAPTPTPIIAPLPPVFITPTPTPTPTKHETDSTPLAPLTPLDLEYLDTINPVVEPDSDYMRALEPPTEDIMPNTKVTPLNPNKKRGPNARISSENLQGIAFFYRDHPEVTSDEMARHFGVGVSTVYRAIDTFNVPRRRPTGQHTPETKQKLSERMKEIRANKKWVSNPRKPITNGSTSTDNNNELIPVNLSNKYPEPIDLDSIIENEPLLTLQTMSTPPLAPPITTTNTKSHERKWRVYVVREVEIEIEAPTLLDALAKADADPLNVEVVGVLRNTHHAN